MPKISSEDRLASATEGLIEILKKPHPLTPFLDQGTKTNDAIRKLQKNYTPRQRNEISTRLPGRASPRMGLPTIDEDEIGTIIMGNYNNKIQQGEVTHYFTDEKKYFIVYESGENEKVNNRTLNRYRCTDTNRYRTRQMLKLSTIPQRANIVKANKNKLSLAGAKLPGHFAMAVYDEATGKIIDYKQLYKLLLFYTSCRETVNIREFYPFTEHLRIRPTSLMLMSRLQTTNQSL